MAPPLPWYCSSPVSCAGSLIEISGNFLCRSYTGNSLVDLLPLFGAGSIGKLTCSSLCELTGIRYRLPRFFGFPLTTVHHYW